MGGFDLIEYSNIIILPPNPIKKTAEGGKGRERRGGGDGKLLKKIMFQVGEKAGFKSFLREVRRGRGGNIY